MGTTGVRRGPYARVAARVRERWNATEGRGPDTGGTVIYITAVGLAANEGDGDGGTGNSVMTVSPAGLGGDGGVGVGHGGIGGTRMHRYSTPGGGPGAPRPFNVDPTSAGNGPPITGTFYPQRQLSCLFSCRLLAGPYTRRVLSASLQLSSSTFELCDRTTSVGSETHSVKLS